MDNISRIDTYLSFVLTQNGYAFFVKILSSFKPQKLFEEFLKDWLTIRNDGKIPRDESLSSEFVIYFQKISELRTENEILTELAKYAKYFLKLSVADIQFEQAKEKIKQINSYNARDAYPFLMEVMDDVENERINEEILDAILNTVLSFIRERESGSMSAITASFANLSSDVNRMLALKAYSPKIISETDNGSGYGRISG